MLLSFSYNYIYDPRSTLIFRIIIIRAGLPNFIPSFSLSIPIIGFVCFADLYTHCVPKCKKKISKWGNTSCNLNVAIIDNIIQKTKH